MNFSFTHILRLCTNYKMTRVSIHIPVVSLWWRCLRLGRKQSGLEISSIYGVDQFCFRSSASTIAGMPEHWLPRSMNRKAWYSFWRLRNEIKYARMYSLASEKWLTPVVSLHAGLSAQDLAPTLAHLVNLCSSPSTPYAEFVMNFGTQRQSI